MSTLNTRLPWTIKTATSDVFEQRTPGQRVGAIPGGNELLGVNVALEQPASHQGADACFDHHRWAAQIGLVAAKIVIEAVAGRLVYEAVEPVPVAFLRRLAQRRHVPEIRVPAGEVNEH